MPAEFCLDGSHRNFTANSDEVFQAIQPSSGDVDDKIKYASISDLNAHFQTPMR